MGAIHVDVTVRHPADPSRSWQGTFLVDTGSTDTVVPPECVDAVGLEPRAQCTYELADGRSVRMPIATADIEFLDEYVGSMVVFGEPGTKPLLGAIAMESVGVEVDPSNGELRKLPAVRLKATHHSTDVARRERVAATLLASSCVQPYGQRARSSARPHQPENQA